MRLRAQLRVFCHGPLVFCHDPAPYLGGHKNPWARDEQCNSLHSGLLEGRTMNKFSEAVEKLKGLHGSIRRDEREAGGVILEYLGDSAKPEREKMLRKLCDAAGISRATAFNYTKAYRDFEKLPKPIVEKAEKAFKKITAPIREKLLQVHTANPGETAEKIVELTKSGLKPKPKRAVAPTAKERQEKLFDYAENLYRHVDPETRERELRSLVKDLLTYFSVPTKEVA